MKVSLLGPSNLKKYAALTGIPPQRIDALAERIGTTLAEQGHELIVVFNYSGILKKVGDAYKKAGGKLVMLYTEDDHDWDTKVYMHFLAEADRKVETKDWHDLLYRLVSDSDVVLCAGLSAGVFTELGYMKWNVQEGKGAVRHLIGLTDLLRGGVLPPEITYDLGPFVVHCTVSELPAVLMKEAL